MGQDAPAAFTATTAAQEEQVRQKQVQLAGRTTAVVEFEQALAAAGHFMLPAIELTKYDGSLHGIVLRCWA